MTNRQASKSHQVALDLDDRVKVNYAKLGATLKKILALEAKDEA